MMRLKKVLHQGNDALDAIPRVKTGITHESIVAEPQRGFAVLVAQSDEFVEELVELDAEFVAFELGDHFAEEEGELEEVRDAELGDLDDDAGDEVPRGCLWLLELAWEAVVDGVLADCVFS